MQYAAGRPKTALLALGACALLSSAASGCFTGAEARQPDPDRLYFPTGLVISPGRTTLYVANSDFDLQFAGGSVQALDANALRAAFSVIALTIDADEGSTDGACAAASRGGNPDPWLNPGPCSAFEVKPYIRNVNFIGAFASGLLLTHDLDSKKARLFAAVRGDPSITYFDVQDDRTANTSFEASFTLYCAKESDNFCGASHRLGQDHDRTLRGIQLPADPVGMAASADGVAIVAAHQSKGAASLVVNDWQHTPALSYFASNLPSGPTELATITEPAFVALARAEAAEQDLEFDYRSSFALTFRATAEVDILQYYPDTGAVPPRPFLVRSQAIPITVGASSYDSRGIAVVDTERKQCEAVCTTLAKDARLGCLQDCAEQIPLRVYMANRSPASLLIGRINTILNTEAGPSQAPWVSSAYETLFMHDSVPLNFGPSRVEVGKIVSPEGELVDRVFAVCFDSRSVFSLDPVTERIESVIRTGRGPHDIAVDSGVDDEGNAYSYLYIGHFTDSYIGVVDLDARRPHTFGQMFASIGTPSAPTESR